jgi:hypothetical protein
MRSHHTLDFMKLTLIHLTQGSRRRMSQAGTLVQVARDWIVPVEVDLVASRINVR